LLLRATQKSCCLAPFGPRHLGIFSQFPIQPTGQKSLAFGKVKALGRQGRLRCEDPMKPSRQVYLPSSVVNDGGPSFFFWVRVKCVRSLNSCQYIGIYHVFCPVGKWTLWFVWIFLGNVGFGASMVNFGSDKMWWTCFCSFFW
jgi:hypothetical protein